MIVEKELGDITVIIDEEHKTKSSKAILMIGNSIFYKQITDKEFNGNLQLYEECNLDAFLEIEKYYGGGYMNIDVNNVCEILRISMFYYDSKIFKICENFIKNHINEKMVVEIFNITKLKYFNRSTLYELSNTAIMDNTYKYISKSIIIISLK